ncbi:MAG: ferrous iron transport protein A [Methanosarcinales archaeon]|nr:MAG: ferrous iron transport protein A [Methanosarcinales archaeon]
MITLTELGIGKVAIVKHLEGGTGFQRRMASLGIRVGKTIRTITSGPLRGPIVVEVDGARVAIGRGMAAKVFVEVKG